MPVREVRKPAEQHFYVTNGETCSISHLEDDVFDKNNEHVDLGIVATKTKRNPPCGVLSICCIPEPMVPGI